ncbi:MULTISPECIES: heavy-metal-associated domain-containing protein [unclassified Frondihabitans]|uniref:heavy-metal-associated domain-containing protein n=1 Tax=unclassified Frondihabitans TaxID=2626248 RepID=UPI000F4E7844|nr:MULTISPECIES: heavy-metal-associated domain-containing protein [unclassified Frondihabitans]RPE79087.1 copper chaperone CopZ [Frondihabitans sp. PhB153]RPF09367.1 copper chaperone CopZ [Frondihabitans sp. PhB161]
MTPSDNTTSTTFLVDGMTCDHCVRAVTDELSAVPGVTAVSIDLRPGASSSVTVVSTRPLAEPEVREAVDEAGYDLQPAVS